MNDPTDNYFDYFTPLSHLETYQSESGMYFRCLHCHQRIKDVESIGEHFISEANIFYCKKSRPSLTQNKQHKQHKKFYHPYYHHN
jgi:hypothetical protein